jgi:hypothetical protein
MKNDFARQKNESGTKEQGGEDVAEKRMQLYFAREGIALFCHSERSEESLFRRC